MADADQTSGAQEAHRPLPARGRGAGPADPSRGQYGDISGHSPVRLPLWGWLFDPVRVPVGTIAWLVLLAVWLAWAPFRWRIGPPAFQTELEFDAETLTHLGLLAPLGAALALVGRVRTWRGVRIAALGVVVAATVLEAGQRWIAARSLSGWDLGAGWIGGFAAIAIARGLLRIGLPRRGLFWGLLVGLWITVALAVNFGSWRQNAGLRLAGWNPRFAVVEGDELGGQRPYVGDVTDGRICAGEGEDRFCTTAAAALEERERLVDVAERTQIVELSAWVRSASDTQSGPTRILTFSSGPYGRNLTLGQNGTSLVLRVRSPRAGPNGVWHQFVLPDAVVADRRTRVDGGFRRGIVHLSSRGPVSREGEFAAPFHGTLFVSGAARYRAALMFHGRSLMVGMLAFFAGTGIGIGLRYRRVGRALTIAVALSLALLWLLQQAVWHGPLAGLGDHLLVAATTAVGALAGAWDRQRLSAP